MVVEVFEEVQFQKNKGTSIKDVRRFWTILDIPTYLCPMFPILCLLPCPIFAEIPTYPKIGRPLWTFPNEQKKVDTRMHIARNTGTLILISHIQMLNTSGLFKRLKVVNS